MTEETNKEKKKRLKAERKAKAIAKKANEAHVAKKKKKAEDTAKVEATQEPTPLKRVFSKNAGALALAIKSGNGDPLPNMFYAAEELQPLFETLAEYKNDVIQPIMWAKGYIHDKQMEKSRLMDIMMHEMSFWEKYVTKRDEFAELNRQWYKCNDEIWRGKRRLDNAELHMFRVSLKMQEHYFNL